eukprot:720525-Pleurochrysis_carterae.AAC.2
MEEESEGGSTQHCRSSSRNPSSLKYSLKLLAFTDRKQLCALAFAVREAKGEHAEKGRERSM